MTGMQREWVPCPQHPSSDMALVSGKYGPWYRCLIQGCDYACAAHPNGAIVGTPADGATRRARAKLHETFDRLWRGHEEEIMRRRARSAAYRWLSAFLGVSKQKAHIGNLDRRQCERVLQELVSKGIV